jgi:hypothetical protein
MLGFILITMLQDSVHAAVFALDILANDLVRLHKFEQRLIGFAIASICYPVLIDLSGCATGIGLDE